MKRTTKNRFLFSLAAFSLFVLLTIALRVIDVQAIGPNESRIGFAALNGFVFRLTSENLLWYHITDWLGILPILVAFGFAVLGLAQWIRRKKISLVDTDILLLGGFYLLVIAAYAGFELWIVNYRPVLIDGVLEASYPSSHTMIVLCIMASAMMLFHTRLTSKRVRITAEILSTAVIVVTIIGRAVSGAHWFTDILGGLLLGFALVFLYDAAVRLAAERAEKQKHKKSVARKP